MLFGRMFSIVINFVVQVLMVRYLVKSDFGAFAYAMSFVTIGSSIAVFGLGKTITRFVPIFQERQQYREMAGTVVLAIVSVFSIGACLVLLLHGMQHVAEPNLARDPLSISLLLVLIILCPIQGLENIFEGLFAIFASPKALFARRFLVGPLLKLGAVLPLVFLHSNVWLLAWSYVLAGIVGSIYSCIVLWGVIRRAGLLVHFRPSVLSIPLKKIFSFSAPMVISDLLPTVRVAMVSIILEMFRGTVGVASYRAVLPLARLNHAPRDSFRLLFTPSLSRMFARGDHAGVEHAYWQSTIWIAVLTFPLFITSFALADQLTVLLFGSQYADSASLFSVLLVGYYLSAVFGFSTYTLRVYGHIRRIFLNDVCTAALTIALAIVLIPKFGAMGGAVATAASLLIGAALNKAAVLQYGIVRSIERPVVHSCLSIVGVTSGMLLLRTALAPGIGVSVIAALLSTFGVFWMSLPVLNIETTFPELARAIPFRHRRIGSVVGER